MTLQPHTDTVDAVQTSKRQRIIAVFCFAVMVTVTFVIAFFIFRDIFNYEFSHAYTADAPLYWAVGRGMLNGLTPYAEMYENKPMMVFLISALSFLLSNDTVICNLISFFAALAITALPALAVSAAWKRTKISPLTAIQRTAVYLAVLLSGLLVTVYSEVRSGGFQVEAIGAAFSILFIYLSIKLKNAETRRRRFILTAVSAIVISCAVMTKEPFLLASVFGALMFVDSMRDFLRGIVIPCVTGGVLTVGALAIGGVLIPYLSIYIKRMLETRLSGGSSAFSRAGNLHLLFNDIKKFSVWLLVLTLLFILLSVVRVFLQKKGVKYILFHLVRVIAAIFIASFCVGMGGQYYNHHFVFAVPIYCAFIIYGGTALCEILPDRAVIHAATAVGWMLVLLTVIPQIGNPYAGDYTDRYDAITAQADYVDALLDYYGEQRYQFIGFNGEDVFFGLTKHSPQGPVFAQDPDNFTDTDTWFAKQLVKQLDRSDIVIQKALQSPALNEYITEKLNSAFTVTPAVEFSETVPDGFDCTIYFRKAKYE